MKKKLILFDIDGTLLNVQSGIAFNIFADTLNEVFGVGITIDNLPSFRGKTDLQILADIESNFGLEENLLRSNAEKLWDLLYRKFENTIRRESVEVLPGVLDLLEIFSNSDEYVLGLVTGNFRQNAYLKLSTASISEYFPFGAFGCENQSRNILPRIALERASAGGFVSSDFNSRNALIIGDTPFDVECAKANNIPVLAVATGGVSISELEEHRPDLLLKDLSDSGKVFDTINKLINDK